VAADLDVGIAGYGLAGAVFHAPLVAATPGLRVAAIGTSDSERAERARRDHPDARVVDRLDDVLAGLDVVVVASPNRWHVPNALAALEAGAAVVVDKPLAASAAEGRRLTEAARRQGRVLTVFHNRRWDGDFLTVRRLVAEDRLGPVARFESRFERWRPQVKEGAWRELADPADAGGLLFDLGSHLVDQAMVLFGPPREIYAEIARRRPGAQVDDDVFVALAHADGVRSHLWAGAVAGRPGPRFRVLGLRGAYVKEGLDPQEDALRAGESPRDGEWGVEPRERWGRLVAGNDGRAVPTEPGDYPAFYAGLVSALRDGGPAPVDAADGVAVLEVLDAARASAEEKRVVEL
jgi:scyllo-inositol 2-dehydrogenase (NADP+)